MLCIWDTEAVGLESVLPQTEQNSPGPGQGLEPGLGLGPGWHALGSVPGPHKPSMMLHTYDPSTH